MIPVTTYAGRHVAVFGLGRTGLAASRALAAGGAHVHAWDDHEARRREAEARGVSLSDLYRADWGEIAALVLSPGVPLTHPEPHPVVRMARTAAVPVIGDLELFARARSGLGGASLVLVTGTNGKSTTTALVGHVLATAGMDVAIGGNIGRAVLDLDPVSSGGAYVIEVSSFQIDLAPSLAGDAVVLLNLAPDHLDRHGDMAGYAAVKRRLVAQEREGGIAVIGVDDPFSEAICEDAARARGTKVIPVSVTRPLERGVYVRDGRLHDLIENGEAGPVLGLGGCPRLPGSHNWQNAAAAYAVARVLGVGPSDIAAAFAAFPGLPHRQEPVASLRDVAFVNDSKATNADAAARALACYDRIYWIAGGVAKEGGIGGLEPFWPRIRHAYLIGAAADAFARSLSGHVACSLSRTLERAVAEASRDAFAAAEPAVVLLSPACASFDQFRDFEARGDAFRAAVETLVPAEALS